MEELLKLLIELKVESASAVTIAQWYIVAHLVGGLLRLVGCFAIVAYILHRLYKIIDRTTEK